MLVENPEKHDLELTALEHGLKKRHRAGNSGPNEKALRFEAPESCLALLLTPDKSQNNIF
jgi:hypothetical protein